MPNEKQGEKYKSRESDIKLSSLLLATNIDGGINHYHRVRVWSKNIVFIPYYQAILETNNFT